MFKDIREVDVQKVDGQRYEDADTVCEGVDRHVEGRRQLPEVFTAHDDNDEDVADDPYGKHDRWQVEVKDTGQPEVDGGVVSEVVTHVVRQLEVCMCVSQHQHRNVAWKRESCVGRDGITAGCGHL